MATPPLKLAPSRLKALIENLESLDIDRIERMKYTELTREDREWFVERYEELQMTLKSLKRVLWFVNVNGATTITQRLVTDTSNLTTTDVTNDTLITNGTPIDFRWNDPRTQDYSINVGSGQSVEEWQLLRDHVHNIDAFRVEWNAGTGKYELVERMGMVMSVYDEPTHLQCFEWDGHLLKPTFWQQGVTVDLRQQVALDIPPL